MPWDIISERLPLDRIIPLTFLETQTVCQCGHCKRVLADSRSWSKTCKVDHKITDSNGQFQQLPGQAIVMGNTRRYIVVTQHLSDNINVSFVAMANTFDDDIAKQTPLEEVSRLEANHFIKAMKFDKALNGFEPSDLVHAMNDDDIDIHGLQKHLRDLLSRIKLDLSMEGDIVLQQLARRSDSTDPATVNEFRYDILDKTLYSVYMSTIGRLIKYMWTMASWDGRRKTPCILNARQQVAIRKAISYSWNIDDISRILEGDAILYELFASILEDRQASSQFDSVVLSAMAVLALDNYGRGWKDARQFGNHASGFIKVGLMMVYGRCVQEDATSPGMYIPDMPRYFFRNKTFGSVFISFEITRYTCLSISFEIRCTDYLKGGRLKTLIAIMEKTVYTAMSARDGTQLPLERIFKLEDEVGAFRLHASPPENVEWRGDKCVAFGIVASRDTIGAMMREQLTSLDQTMKAVLLGHGTNDRTICEVVPCDLRLLSDDGNLEALDHNFTMDARNAKWMDKASRLLLSTIDADPQMTKAWRTGGKFNQQQWLKWKIAYAEAQRELSLATYWGSGQPTRYPELMSLRFRNTQNGGTRNILLYGDAITTRTIYNKSAWRDPSKASSTWRRMNDWLSRIIVIWIAVVVPFAEFMEYQATKACKAVDDEKDGGQMQYRRNGFLFSINCFGTPTFVTQPQMRDLCKGLCMRRFGHKINLAEMRHLLKAFIHHFIDNKAHTWAGEAIGDAAEDDDEMAVVGEQLAGHSVKASRVYYAIETRGSPFLRSMFMCSAVHRMFGFGTTTANANESWTFDDPDDNFEASVQADRQRQTSKLWNGEDLVGTVVPGSKLHPHQREVLDHIANPSVRDIIYVAPTGAGKSVAFMLPALANDGGQYVLIEPTKALQHDMARRLEAASITIYVWMPAITDREQEAKGARVSKRPLFLRK